MSFFARKIWRPFKADVKQTLLDYKEVGKMIVEGWVAHPFRAVVKLSAFSAVVWASTHTPDMIDYRSDVHEASVTVNELSDKIRRRSSFEYVQDVMAMDQRGYLNYTWLGPLALITRSGVNEDCNTFEANYSRGWLDRLKSLRQRTVDIGFYHQWKNLQEAMIDYDIPEDYDDKLDEDFVSDYHQVRPLARQHATESAVPSS